MRCPGCNDDNPERARFCQGCGARLARICPRCGGESDRRARFCLECGSSLDLASQPTSDFHGPATAPRSYTPPHLAERILASASSLEGERKQVTVLFADLKGSTELIQGLDPEEAQQLLDGAVKAMMEAVHRYEGTVTQILGDGIMALFGAPLAHEDHAVRACYAALALQAGVRRYAGQARQQYGVEVHARVGLNSGEVVVRSIANDLRMDYSAMGPTVHLASRMEQLARDDSIRLTPQTLQLVEGFVDVQSLGLVPVRGLTEPVEVFDLVAARPVRRRLQAAAAGGLSHFVGRERELAALEEALERAGSGHGQAVALVGEAGVGKSRLVYEFTHRPRPDWLILESSSVSYGRASPYLPVIDLLKSYFQLEGRDDEATARAKLIDRPARLGPDTEPYQRALLALLDLATEDPAWQALAAPLRRQRTLEAVKRLLLRESQTQPLLLVFEDLHWIDSETQALLESLVESLPTTRVLLLVDYRPEYEHRWGNLTYYTQLRLDALSPAGADALLRSLLGSDAAFGPLKRLLVERTEGNPFFLEECVQTLVQTGALVGERGGFALAKAVPELQVPSTVQAVLAARIDRLEPDSKRLLQTAAVIGKDVPFALLQLVTELPEDALQQGTARLQAQELLYEVGFFPDRELTFKHALTHEVAYGSLLQTRRRQLHGKILDLLEAGSTERTGDLVERLAHHSVRGEVWEKALDYLRQAGAKATWRMAHREAVSYFEQALEAIRHLPERRETIEQAIDLRFDLRASLRPLTDYKRIGECLREAEPLAEAIGDRLRLGRIYDAQAHLLWMTLDGRRAVEVGQRAIAIARELDDLGLSVIAAQTVGQALMDLADYAAAEALLQPTVAFLSGERAHERLGQAGLLSIDSRNSLIWSLSFRGEFGQAVTLGEEGLRIADAAEHPPSIASAVLGGGLALELQGEAERASALLERGLAIRRAHGLVGGLATTACFLGLSYMQAHRPAEAVLLLEEGLATAEAAGHRPCTSLWTGWLAGAYLLLDRSDDARRTAGRSLEMARAAHERGYEAMALHRLGEVAAQAGPADATSEGYFGEALTRAEQLGMRPLQAHCHLGLGRLYRKTGRADQARAELTAAAELYRSMGMIYWLPEAEAELAGLR